MIKPITVFCWILALGSGLYLYRAKHEVELIDQHIEQIAKQTAELRVESRGLLDEWIRRGEPEQLHKYSDEYLGLKTIAPTQFARLSDLPNRLPAPQADPPATQPDVIVQSPEAPPADVVTAADPLATAPRSTDADAADDLPVPPIPPSALPAAAPVVTAVSLPAVTAIPLQARPVTPRPSANPPEQEAARPHPARVVEEPAATPVKPPSVASADLRPVVPAQTSKPVPAPGPAHALPPLQAQGPANVQGLPPLQAQGTAQGLGQRRGPVFGQPSVPPQTSAQAQTSAQTMPLPAEPRIADNRPADPRREFRPIQLQPQLAQPQQPPPQPPQSMDPRGAPPRPVPPSNGSLLGMSRGPVPLPLPSPTPVSATWSGPASSRPTDSGR